jgi:prepilin-type N-terminal cleavage/methylation domain-containing protein
MKKTTSGFTIVELLIVIVVIAVLAAITVVAFNGVQQRAENSKTLAAATAFYKAIKQYEIDNGEIPHSGFDSCLGDSYVWEFDGVASGSNMCRNAASSYYTFRGTVNNDLKSYMNGKLPNPSMQTIGTSTAWRRGIVYTDAVIGGTVLLTIVLRNVSSCPVLAGRAHQAADPGLGNGMICYYGVGTRLR